MNNVIEMVEIPDEDGVIHLYHPDTGEYAGPKSRWLPAEIVGEDEFLQVMGAMAKKKAILLSKKALIDTIIKQQQKMLGNIQSQIDYLENQYLNQIGRYVETALPKKADGTYRVKTLHCPYGSVAIRSTMPKISVANEEAAGNTLPMHTAQLTQHHSTSILRWVACSVPCMRVWGRSDLFAVWQECHLSDRMAPASLRYHGRREPHVHGNV